jgi:hypothetical protein
LATSHCRPPCPRRPARRGRVCRPAPAVRKAGITWPWVSPRLIRCNTAKTASVLHPLQVPLGCSRSRRSTTVRWPSIVTLVNAAPVVPPTVRRSRWTPHLAAMVEGAGCAIRPTPWHPATAVRSRSPPPADRIDGRVLARGLEARPTTQGGESKAPAWLAEDWGSRPRRPGPEESGPVGWSSITLNAPCSTAPSAGV